MMVIRAAGRGFRAGGNAARQAAGQAGRYLGAQGVRGARYAGRQGLTAGRYLGTQGIRAAGYAGRQGLNAGRYAVGQAGNGIRYAWTHPRGTAVTTATAAGGVVGYYIGSHTPEVAVNMTQGIADMPHYVGDFFYHLSSGNDALSSWGFHSIGDAANYASQPIRAGYNNSRTFVDHLFGSAGALGGSIAGYRLTNRLPRRARPAPTGEETEVAVTRRAIPGGHVTTTTTRRRPIP